MNSQGEIPWWLPYLVYAIATAILTGIVAPTFLKFLERYLRKRDETRERDLLKEKERVEDEIKKYTEILKALGECFRYIRLDEFYSARAKADYTAFSTEFINNTQLKDKLIKFDNKFSKCYDWYISGCIFLERIVNRQIKKHLPITKEYIDEEIEGDYIKGLIIENEVLRHNILRGDEIDTNFMNKKFPIIIGAIRRCLQEPEDETSLNMFFNELNDEVKGDRILVRYRKEKEELIVYNEYIIKDLEENLVKLKERLDSLK